MTEESSNVATPSSNSSKKRPVSSPLDSFEPKKYKSIIELESDMSETTSFKLSNEDLLAITSTIKDSLTHDLKDTANKCFDDRFEELTNRVINGVLAGVQNQLDHLTSENAVLRAEIVQLKKKSDQAEQYSRRNNVRISGLPEVSTGTDENTDIKVIEMASKLGVFLTLQDIDISHRLGVRKPDRRRDIIVKFTTRRAKHKIYKARVLAKDRGYKGTYINEDLTKERSKLLFLARQLAKKGTIDSAWSFEGNILAKDKSNKVHRITSEDDVSTLDAFCTAASASVWNNISRESSGMD